MFSCFCHFLGGMIDVGIDVLTLILVMDIILVIQVWDVISNQQAVEIVSSSPRREESAERLVAHAVRAWKRKRPGLAMDDISAICLFFHSSSPSSSPDPIKLP